jgi:diaminopimelate decarboxylase
MPTTRDPNGALHLGGVALESLARDPAIGTPAYVYDLSAMAQEARDLRAAFDDEPHLVAYAVKANSAGPIVRTLAKEACGADVVSGAELALALACGISPDRIVFSGVAKTDGELDQAIAAGPSGIAAIQVESVEEIPRVLARAAALGRRARISIRVNPAVDLATLDTHAHIATGHDEAKFGVALADVATALSALRSGSYADLVGFSVHVGSQFTKTGAYVDAARALFRLVRDMRAEHAPRIAFVDTGGGFGIDYGGGATARPRDFVLAVRAEKSAAGLGDLALHVEPGRSLVAAHGVLVARVLQSKVSREEGSRRWLMIDAGMNDLLRPALYQAWHRIVPLVDARLAAAGASSAITTEWRVVGPVCESSDDFGFHALPVTPPEFVAILDAGAYGYTMASAYNGRSLPVEIFLDGGKVTDRRERGSVEAWVHERAFGGAR